MMHLDRQDSHAAGPLPSIRRLPLYLDVIQAVHLRGETHITTTMIAEALGLTAIQVRKDLAITGIEGKPRRGYEVAALICAIRAFLSWDQAIPAVLIGVGHLGQALLGYRDFAQNGMDIVAACDVDPSLHGQHMHGITVHALADLKEIVQQRDVRMAVLCVPRSAAQAVAQHAIEAGITALWNFADPGLRVPAGIVTENVQLSGSLAVLSHRIRSTS